MLELGPTGTKEERRKKKKKKKKCALQRMWQAKQMVILGPFEEP